MTEAYTLPCECGDEARREFRQGARPVLVAGFQCPGCNRILLGQIPGEGKYQREKTRALRELVLRDLVRECIERHIDPDQLERSRAVEPTGQPDKSLERAELR